MFWDNDTPINTQCYCGILTDLFITIKIKHLSMLTRGLTVLHNNAHCPGHTNSMHWKESDHSHTAQTCPCHHHTFRLDEDVKAMVMQWEFFVEVTHCLVSQWDAWLSTHEDYFNGLCASPRTILEHLSFEHVSGLSGHCTVDVFLVTYHSTLGHNKLLAHTYLLYSDKDGHLFVTYTFLGNPSNFKTSSLCCLPN